MRRMKIFLPLPLSVMLLCAACAPVEPETPPANGPAAGRPESGPAFYLDELPELAPYAPDEISSRYYDGYTDDLRPSTDYGPLYPYIGRRLMDTIGPNFLYGLCDGKGKIVTDAVFVSVRRATDHDGNALLCLEYQPPAGADAETVAHRYGVAAADGSWRIRDLPGTLRAADADWLLLTEPDETDWDFGVESLFVCDYSGMIHWQYSDVILRDYAEGAMLLATIITEPEWQWRCRLLRLDGTPLNDDVFLSTGYFQDGLVQVQEMESGLWGLLRTDGSYAAEPQYADESTLYEETGFTPAEPGMNWPDTEYVTIDNTKFTRTALGNGLYQLWGGDFAGIMDEAGNWLLKLRIRELV